MIFYNPNNKKNIIFLFIFMIFFNACNSEKVLVLNEKAPEIATMDMNGESVKLSDFHNKAIVMVFFKNGCEACVGILPELDNLAKNNKNIAILAINTSNTKEEIKEFLEDTPLVNTHILRDSLQITARRFIINMTPSVILLDANHIARDKIIGAGDFSALKMRLDKIL